jgi:tRNA A-37 threonylcarbamoyl transferase component Bud32
MNSICFGCGAPVRPGARYCGSCGAAQPGSSGRMAAGSLLDNGHYRIERPLGKGGMGAVFLASDTYAFDRSCVIKEMLPYFDPTDPDGERHARERFAIEGRTLATINHSGVPKIYQYFSEGGSDYIVMEFVEGDNLEQALTHVDDQGRQHPGQPLPAETVAGYGISLCKVLEYLAARTDPRTGQLTPIIHHDIKPANIILDANSGEVRLVDFGTAKLRVSTSAFSGSMKQSSVYGTEGYAPLEQYRGQSQPRSDVYALAATLYHLLTDDDPRDHAFDFPLLAALPVELRKALEPALDEDVLRRPDATGFRDLLEVWLDQRSAAKAASPFVFGSGDRVRSVDELADVCDARWDEAREHLYKGHFARWLGGSLHRHDLSALADDITQRQNDQDVGLDQFVRGLDPRRKTPAPVVSPARLQLGRLTTNAQKDFTFQIANGAGRGRLKGKLACDPPVAWLRIPAGFTGDAVTLDAAAISRDLAEGQTYRTTLRVTTPYGTETSTPVQIRIGFSWSRLLGRVAVGALTGLSAGILLGYLWLPNTMQAPRDPLIMAGMLAMVALLATRKAALQRQASLPMARGLFAGILVFMAGLYLGLSLLYQFSMMAANRSVEQAALRMALEGLLIGLLLGLFLGLRAIGKRLLAVVAPMAVLAGVVLSGWSNERVVSLQEDYVWEGVTIPVAFIYDTLDLSAPAVPGLVQFLPTPVPVPSIATPTFSAPTNTPATAVTATRNPTSTPMLAGSAMRPGDLAIGGQARVATQGGARLTVRKAPGQSSSVVTRVNAGTTLDIVGGPRSADGYRWWQVRGNGFTGWAAENWLAKIP